MTNRTFIQNHTRNLARYLELTNKDIDTQNLAGQTALHLILEDIKDLQGVINIIPHISGDDGNSSYFNKQSTAELEQKLSSSITIRDYYLISVVDLIERGARIDIPENNGTSVRDLMMESGHEVLQKLAQPHNKPSNKSGMAINNIA